MVWWAKALAMKAWQSERENELHEIVPDLRKCSVATHAPHTTHTVYEQLALCFGKGRSRFIYSGQENKIHLQRNQ